MTMQNTAAAAIDKPLTNASQRCASAPARLPRLGFLGVGWIGRSRLQALVEAQAAEVVAVADASAEMCRQACEMSPESQEVESLDELLELPLDGVVIATPSAQHADQSRQALEAGLAVFCQKPLARTAAETLGVLSAARRRDCLLGVDLSYRHLKGIDEARRLIQSGELGEVFAADLTFHNAYGPDKSWFYDPVLSGGGCTIDLGTHLVDLALWMLAPAEIEHISSRLFAGGRPLSDPAKQVEDYALAELQFSAGAVARIACSWKLPAGREAEIQAVFYGTRGGVALRNVNGSFYDFVVSRFEGTRTHGLAAPPDAWGGRAIVAWARQLARGNRYDPAADHLLKVASVLDGIYSGASNPSLSRDPHGSAP